jgi:hypothetical protein
VTLTVKFDDAAVAWCLEQAVAGLTGSAPAGAKPAVAAGE